MVQPAPQRTGRETQLGLDELIRRRLVCRGTVQGVGFRPHVHRLAGEFGLSGCVRNDGEGATIEVEGLAATVATFRATLVETLPPLARLESLDEVELTPTGARGFRVESSGGGERRHALVPPDAKLCAACRAEMDDPRDCRHAYPFTTCTHCGPRFTLTESLPYDRERTSMRIFPMCPSCAAEYADPSDRRFHAEPVCCPACGPQLVLSDARGSVLGDERNALSLVRAALSAGRIAAIQGIGGFQLACRADDEDAVGRLRASKQRPSKPLAILTRDVATARTLVVLRDEDERLLDSARGPIVLAPKRHPTSLATNLAPGVADLGVMLPTTPLHVELFRDVSYDALVMTSGNAGDEPICRTPDEARMRLAPFADVFLTHDREVVRRCDDSVVRTMPSGHVVVRRSRGYVPEPVALPIASPEPVLALGAHLQDTVALAVERASFPSQHVGDLDTESARAFQLEVASGLERFLQVEARVIAVDLHPDYPSTWLGERLAHERGGRLVRVQHHVAHAAAVLGEHGRFPDLGARAGAVVFDGTGFGPDGTAWGAEWLEIDGDLRWRRVAHAERVPLIGGEAAVREPWRVAVAALARAGLTDAIDRPPLARRVASDRWRAVAALARSSGAPLASSAGRLFEAAGALLGLCDRNTYEGEAAARLETSASRAHGVATPWDDVLRMVDDTRRSDGARELPSSALIAALARRVIEGHSLPACAAEFHATLAACSARLAACAFGDRVSHVALSGGCFVNRVLTEQLEKALERAGYVVLLPVSVPPGDGGIAYGQTVIASVALARGVTPHQDGGL